MNYLEITGACRADLPLAGIPGKHLSLDSGHHHAGHLYICILPSRIVCRLRHQYLLSARGRLRLDGLDAGKRKRDPGRAAHHAHTLEKIPPPIAGIPGTFFGIAWILIRFTDSNVPWLDSFTTALSIIGMWMLARKYVEQWWAWIVVDVVCCGLYIYKELYFYIRSLRTLLNNRYLWLL